MSTALPVYSEHLSNVRQLSNLFDVSNTWYDSKFVREKDNRVGPQITENFRLDIETKKKKKGQLLEIL